MDKPRIVFMGTPEFAVPSLRLLIERQEDLVCVVTQPDRPVGRGRKLLPSPIKKIACEQGMAVLQPERIREPGFSAAFSRLSADLAVVAAYGQIIPGRLLDMPRHGFINVHSSLLPAYRGAAPVNWALINGDRQTGVTIMQLDEGMDTGDIIIQQEIPILPEDDAATLHDRLAVAGAELLGKALDILREGAWRPVPQSDADATCAPLLKKEDGLVVWENDAAGIANRVRGMTPWPGCFTWLNGRMLKIHRARAIDRQPPVAPGQVVSVSRLGIEVATGRGSLLISQVQIEGKRKMAADEFIRGHRLAPGTSFTKAP